MWQNPQARVQTSPAMRNVAVRRSKHSVRFGQRASSQTVERRPAPHPRLHLVQLREAQLLLADPGRKRRLAADRAGPRHGTTRGRFFVFSTFWIFAAALSAFARSAYGPTRTRNQPGLPGTGVTSAGKPSASQLLRQLVRDARLLRREDLDAERLLLPGRPWRGGRLRAGRPPASGPASPSARAASSRGGAAVGFAGVGRPRRGRPFAGSEAELRLLGRLRPPPLRLRRRGRDGQVGRLRKRSPPSPGPFFAAAPVFIPKKNESAEGDEQHEEERRRLPARDGDLVVDARFSSVTLASAPAPGFFSVQQPRSGRSEAGR